MKFAYAGFVPALFALASCGAEGSRFTVNYAPEFTGSAVHTVSVFGVFKDGRMDAEAWDDLAPHMTRLLGHDACSAAFGTDLVASGAPLASAVDTYTRNYGVTDPILHEFAPAARGDLILVLSIAEPPPSRENEPPPEPPRPVGRGPLAGKRGMASPNEGHSAPVSHAAELSASLFSVPLGRSVGSVSESYAGKNADEGIANLVDKLKEGLPLAHCVGWDFDAHPIDGSKVHDLPEP